jgi:hypothetical protein
MDVRYFFKEISRKKVLYISFGRMDLTSDLYTKNVTGPFFAKHSSRCVG